MTSQVKCLPKEESKELRLTNLGWLHSGVIGIETVLKHVDDLLDSEKRYLQTVLDELENMRSKRTHV